MSAQNALRTVSVSEFAASKGFTQIIPTIRANVNGYPFVTFINDNNEAENVYFSKSSAESIELNEDISTKLKTFQIGFTTNEAGEERVKIISNSGRRDLSSLLS